MSNVYCISTHSIRVCQCVKKPGQYHAIWGLCVSKGEVLRPQKFLGTLCQVNYFTPSLVLEVQYLLVSFTPLKHLTLVVLRSLYMKKVWISFLIYGTFYVIWMGCKPFGTPVYSLTHPTMPTKVYLCTKRRQFLSVVFQVLLRCFCSFPNNSIGLNWICITVSVSKARILHIFGAQYTEFKIIF